MAEHIVLWRADIITAVTGNMVLQEKKQTNKHMNSNKLGHIWNPPLQRPTVCKYAGKSRPPLTSSRFSTAWTKHGHVHKMLMFLVLFQQNTWNKFHIMFRRKRVIVIIVVWMPSIHSALLVPMDFCSNRYTLNMQINVKYTLSAFNLVCPLNHKVIDQTVCSAFGANYVHQVFSAVPLFTNGCTHLIINETYRVSWVHTECIKYWLQYRCLPTGVQI